MPVTLASTLTVICRCGHVQRTASRCFPLLRQQRQIRRAVPSTTLHVLMVALVHYENGTVLVGLPAYLMRQLQLVPNAAAQLIYRLENLRPCN